MSLSNEEVIGLLDDYLHGLLDDETAEEVEHRCAISPACKAALSEARSRFSSLRADQPAEASEQLIQSTVAGIQRDIDGRRLRKRRILFGMLGTLAASLLIVGGLHLSTAFLSPTVVNMAVLGQRDFLAATQASLRIRLTDRSAANQPLANVPVTLELKDKAGQSVQLASLTTDALGSVEPLFQVPNWENGECVLTITAKTPRGNEVVTRTVQVKRSWQLMLTSDKPVYQPGQTIHVRSLALRRPDLKPVGKENVVFSISDPKTNVIFKSTQTQTSPHGIASTDCQLADELLEGAYRISCKVGDTESRLEVQVLKYVLPKFKVDVTLDKRFYLPGDKVQLTVQANYNFGEPVANGLVEVEVSTPSFGNRVLEKLPPVPVRTDARGMAKIDYTVPDFLVAVRPPEMVQPPPIQPNWVEPQGGFAEPFAPQQPGRPAAVARPISTDAQVVFKATVTDSANQQQIGSRETLVTTVPVRIAVFPESGTLVENVSNLVYVVVTRADGSPVKANLRITGVEEDLSTDEHGTASFKVTPRTQQNRVTVRAVDNQGTTLAQKHEVLYCDGTTNDFLVRTDKAVYRGGESMKLTALASGSEPVFVDFIQDGKERITLLSATIDVQGGRGDFTLDLPAELSGTLELCAYRLNEEGLAVRKSRVVYVQPASDLRIQMTLDRSAVLSTASALGLATSPHQGLLLGCTTKTALEGPGLLPYLPGAPARLQFTLTDNQNKPTAGAISLVGVDEAVFGVLQQVRPKERSFFTQERQLLQPVFAIDPQWAPASTGEKNVRFEQALFAATARNLAVPGAPGVQRKPMAPTPAPSESFAANSHTLVVGTYGEKVKQTNVLREKRLSWVLRGWLFVVALGLLSGYAALWLFFSSTTRFVVHMVGVGVLAPLALLGLVFLVMQAGSEKFATFNATGASPGRFSVEDAPMAQQERNALQFAPLPAGPGAADPNKDGAGQPAPRVRKDFPETMLWEPILIADDNGLVAPLEIAKLADSITTWRLTASAVSAEGRLGAAEFPLKVFQPFFVDLNLPVAMTRGDEVSVPVVVYNYLNAPQTVTLELAEGNWFKLTGEANQELQLKPKEVKSIDYRLKVVRVGVQNLQVTARGQGVTDALKKTIEVVPDGRLVEKTENGTLQDLADHDLTLPDNIVEGSGKAFVKIYPSSFSQVVEGLENIFQLPHGCFEQTSSTTYPNVLALDYLKRTGRSQPEVEKKARHYIHLGYQRLLGFETRSGGFDWFGQGEGNVRLTAYGLMEFTDMAKVSDVDPALLERTRTWLLKKRTADGSWAPEGNRMHFAPGQEQADDLSRLASTAYVAWAVYGGKPDSAGSRDTLQYLRTYRPSDIKDPYLVALVANALLAMDPSGQEAGPYVDRLEFLKRTSEDGKFVWWEQDAMGRTMFYGAGMGGQVEATSLAVLALSQTKRHPGTTRNALAWLAAKKDPRGLWYSTQATVLGLKALLAGAGVPKGEGERRIVVKLGGRFQKEIVIPAELADVMQLVDLTPHLKVGDNRLTIKESTDTAAGYQVTFRYHVPEQAQQAVNKDMSINMSYDKKELNVNQEIRVTARVSNHMRQDAAMVMLDLPLPAGFVLAGDDFNELVKKGAIARYQVTPRRILVYLRGLPMDQPQELSYRLRAMIPVKIMATGAHVYEYYAPERQGSSPGVALEVKAGP
jgi:alpha-2-macroglobulin-like protein